MKQVFLLQRVKNECDVSLGQRKEKGKKEGRQRREEREREGGRKMGKDREEVRSGGIEFSSDSCHWKCIFLLFFTISYVSTFFKNNPLITLPCTILCLTLT